MTWEWSHTAEAYSNARENMSDLDDATIAVIFAEWRAAIPGEYGEYTLHTGRYTFALMGATKRIANGERDIMEDYIWERASEQADCTDGGWAAHLCPFGCGGHMVEFDRDSDDDDCTTSDWSDRQEERRQMGITY